ncbi:MAG: hypothetical protein K9I94_11295 [Bacteroidales bacterium]|nr:hypothetical protein [Bacteroidales bacterium]
MKHSVDSYILTRDEQAIINSLLYFDLFDHPLTYEELCHTSKLNGLSQQHFNRFINNLHSKKLIASKGNYYFLKGKEQIVENRQKENKRVRHYFSIARVIARIINSFPFVRGVFVSGSLSKMRAAHDGDIDFFIITEPGRLWISRSLLMIFKKIFLLNSYKYFCLNYFVDTESMEFENKDLYTATEIDTLIPLYNKELYHEFMRQNKWISRYYPNFPMHDDHKPISTGNNWFKIIFESIFNNRWGEQLDTYLMNKTLSYRKKKFSWMDKDRFNTAFITKKNMSKHHPNDFRERILIAYCEKQVDFEKRHKIKLSDRSKKQASKPCYMKNAASG